MFKVREKEFISLARRLKESREKGVIGSELVAKRKLSAQPPDSVYWAASATARTVEKRCRQGRRGFCQSAARLSRTPVTATRHAGSNDNRSE